MFRSVVDNLDERGLFKLTDLPVIASYARNVVLARVAARDVERLGTVIEFKDRGCTKWTTNPAIEVMNKAQNAYEATAVRLGLTPTGRRRMKGEEVKRQKTALEQFEEECDD